MCFRHSNAAKSVPLSRRPEFLRPATIDRMRIPYKKPLYWKWMWSMIKSPGERRIEMAAACACFFEAPGEVLTRLDVISDVIAGPSKHHIQV